MSLINEALKKAQRQRLDEGAEPGATTSASATGAYAPRRGKVQRSNTVVLLGSGAVVLVVLSVVFTVYLVNRPADAKRTAVAAPPSSASSAATSVAAPLVKSTPTSTPSAPAAVETAPPIVVPKMTPPTPAPMTTPASTSDTAAVATVAVPNTQPAAPTTPRTSAPVATTPPPATATGTAPATAPTSAGTPAASQLATPTASAPAATDTPAAVAPVPSTAATLPPGTPDERVAAFVDSIRVTGIRSSGAESRVLMNERVYRVNDVVERNLGVRLVKAAADSLTFSDPRGVTYVKSF